MLMRREQIGGDARASPTRGPFPALPQDTPVKPSGCDVCRTRGSARCAVVLLTIGGLFGCERRTERQPPEAMPSPSSSASRSQSREKASGASRGYRLATRGELEPGRVPITRLGRILGAVYDDKKRQLYVVGNGLDVEASPSESQIALALGIAPESARVSIEPLSPPGPPTKDAASARALRSGGPAGNGKPVDPIPDTIGVCPDPQLMQLTTSPEVAETDFGWVMYEADRLLKSYSVGADSVTRRLLQPPGNQPVNRLQLEHRRHSDRSARTQHTHTGPQRFWIHPNGAAVAEATPRALWIRDASFRISTESMEFVNGKLASAKNARDSASEHFAQVVTESYGLFARREAVFLRLEQLLRLFVIAEWVRKNRLPVSPSWLLREGNGGFHLPRRVAEISMRAVSSDDARIRTVCVAGGVTFAGFRARFESAHSDWIRLPWAEGELPEPGGATRFVQGDNVFVAYAVPGADAPIAPPRDVFDVPLPEGGVLKVRVRPAQPFDRGSYDSADYVVALPALRALNRDPGSSATFGIRGRKDSEVPVRRYEFFAEDGSLTARFDGHEIDQRKARVVVLPDKRESSYRLFPEGEYVVHVVDQRNGNITTFDVRLPTPISDVRDGRLLRFRYGPQGLLEEISLAVGSTSTPLVSVSSDRRRRRIVALTRRKDGKRVVLNAPPVSSRRVRLDSYDEINRRQYVMLAADGTEEVANGHEHLDRHAAEILQVVSRGSPRPHFIADGGLTVMVTGNTVRHLQASIDEPAALLDLAQEYLPRDTTLLSIAAIDSGAAAFYRVGGHYELDLLSHSHAAEHVLGAAAQARFEAIERDGLARTSDPKLEFVYVSEHGGEVLIQRGTEQLKLEKSVLVELLRNHSVPSQRLDQFFDGRNRRDLVVYRPATDYYRSGEHPHRDSLVDPQRFATLLATRYAGRPFRVFLDDDPDDGRENYSMLSPITRSSQISALRLDNFSGSEYVDRGLDQLQAVGVERLGGPDALSARPALDPSYEVGRNALIITGHNDERLEAVLHELGKRGALQGRVVLLVTCYSRGNADLFHEVVRSYGARGVLHHDAEIRPIAVEAVLVEAARLLADLPPQGIPPERLLADAARGVLKREVPGTRKHIEVEKFLRGVLQISWLHRYAVPRQLQNSWTLDPQLPQAAVPGVRFA
jgi:hypothetical protein